MGVIVISIGLLYNNRMEYRDGIVFFDQAALKFN